MTARTDQQPTGQLGSSRHGARTPVRKPAAGQAKLSRRYQGRDRLDASIDQLRRAFVNLAREAQVAGDVASGQRLAELVDQAVVELKRLGSQAEAALLASERTQAAVRRELQQMRAMLNRTPGGPARTLMHRHIEKLEAMLVDPDSTT